MSYRWHIYPGPISSGWLMTNALCHPVETSYHHIACIYCVSDKLRQCYHIIRMTYSSILKSSGWDSKFFSKGGGPLALPYHRPPASGREAYGPCSNYWTYPSRKPVAWLTLNTRVLFRDVFVKSWYSQTQRPCRDESVRLQHPPLDLKYSGRSSLDVLSSLVA